MLDSFASYPDIQMEKSDSKEKLILSAARQEFMSKGFAGARMQDIADAAGANKALVHYYYKSKENLFRIIFFEAVEKLVPQLKSLIENKQLSTITKLEGLVDVYMDMLVANPHLPLFVINEMHSNREVRKKGIQHLLHQLPIQDFIYEIRISTQKNEFKSFDPLHLFLNILSMCVYPFVAAPLIQKLVQFSNKEYETFLLERKNHIRIFVKSMVLNYEQ